MNPATLVLPDVVTGDSWNGLSEVSVTIDGIAPASSLASVVMEFRQTCPYDNPVLTLTSDNGGVQITDVVNWVFNVPPVIMDLPPATYAYCLTVINMIGIVKTYLIGTITVLDC